MIAQSLEAEVAFWRGNLEQFPGFHIALAMIIVSGCHYRFIAFQTYRVTRPGINSNNILPTAHIAFAMTIASGCHYCTITSQTDCMGEPRRNSNDVMPVALIEFTIKSTIGNHQLTIHRSVAFQSY